MDWLDIISVDDAETRGEPLYQQIVRSLKESIANGKLPVDSKLPTNRELAALLKVDRSTVSRAYLELSEEGLIVSHVGRGTFVRSPKTSDSASRAKSATQSASTLLPSRARPIVWAEKFSRASDTVESILSRQPTSTGLSVDAISFGGGIPTEEFYPSDQFQRIVAKMVSSGAVQEMFEYSPAEGNSELRDEVLAYLSRQGIKATADELLIVSGSQQGIDLVSNALIDEGDVVLLEEPSYFWAICNFRARQARLIGIPVDEEGMRVDVLENVLNRQKAKMLYVMPAFQNPTGSTLSAERREKLLEIVREHQVPVLEDNFVGELIYDGQRLPPLRAHEGAQDIVIHQGTFSKALCPGLRLGWLVAPAEVMSRLRAAKRSSDLSTNSMAQVILAHYLKDGLYARHLEHVRSAYRARLETMIRALNEYVAPLSVVPSESSGAMRVSWTVPQGGLFVWVKLPERLSARELLAFAERQGVTFSPGDLFFVNSDRPEFLRLCFIQNSEEFIEEGIKRLGRAVEAYFASVSRMRHAERIPSRRRSEGVLI
ncbi:MAG TPA: PLP-dependent aminotransferase family protein [Candidatus Obscuribacterales bacterium]